jgi:glycosyltransferase involved in cell wall biosynthesis
LYTPDREHFGIVPIEAMNAGTPAICVASGGPLETVLHGLTGFLCQQTAMEFGEAMKRFTTGSVSDSERKKLTDAIVEFTKNGKILNNLDKSLSLSQLMGMVGRAHVQANFTSVSMVDKLTQCISAATKIQKKDPIIAAISRVAPIIFLNILILVAVFYGFSVHNAIR